MGSSQNQFWFIAEITLKLIEDGTTTTINVISRPNLKTATAVADVDSKYYPLLLSVSSLTYGIGQDGLPSASSGGIELLDTPNSLGENRRFSDLLERYTIVNQSIKIKYVTSAAIGAYKDFPDISSLTTAWEGRIASFQKSFSEDSESLSLDIIGDYFESSYCCLKLDPLMFPNIPAKSIGKVLPMIFGTYDGAYIL